MYLLDQIMQEQEIIGIRWCGLRFIVLRVQVPT